MDTQLKLSFCLLFLVVLILFFFFPFQKELNFFHHDFQFHYLKSSGDNFVSTQFIDESKLDAYRPLSGWLFGLFAFNVETFYLAVLFVFVVLFGLLLVFLSKSWVASLFWLSCFTPYYFILGTIAQGIVTFLFVFFVFVKDFRLRLLLIGLSLLTHTWGFWLLGCYWIFEYLFSKDWKNVVFGVCGGSFFPSKATSSMSISEIQSISTGKSLLGFNGLNMVSYVSVFRWLFMFPFLVFCFVGLWRLNKTWFWFCLVVFVLSFVSLYWRFVESVMPLVVLGLVEYYKSSSRRMRFLLIVGALLLIFVQVFNYFSVIQSVHLSLTTLLFNLPCGLGFFR